MISQSSNAGEVLGRYVELALDVFGSAHPTEADRRELADHLNAEVVRWANERYNLGLRDKPPITITVNPPPPPAVRYVPVEGRRLA